MTAHREAASADWLGSGGKYGSYVLATDAVTRRKSLGYPPKSVEVSLGIPTNSRRRPLPHSSAPSALRAEDAELGIKISMNRY